MSTDTLFSRETGAGHAPAIIFLHGGGIGGWMWQEHMAALREFHCLAPDLPEHGRSIGVKPFTMQDASKRIAELIQERAGGKAHLVGLSLGAQLALQILAEYPDRVDRVLATGTLARPIPGSRLLATSMALYGPFKNIPFLIRANMRQYDVPERYYEQFAEDTRLLSTTAFAHIMESNMSFIPDPALKGAQQPVLIVVGEREPGIIKRSAQDLLGILPNAQGVIALGLGHNWPLAAPELFVQTIRAWISAAHLPEQLTPLKS